MDITPASVEKFLAADRAGKLSSKDRKALTAMRQAVMMTPEEQAADLEDSLSEYNMGELSTAIRTATNPAIRGILLEEQNRLLSILSQSAMTAAPPPEEETILDTIGKMLSKLNF